MSKTGEYLIPFDKEGNQLHWANPYEEDLAAWRPNHEFNATLTFEGIHSGRSAKYLSLTDEKGHKYTMFVADLLDLIKRGMVNHGRASERWTFIKRGQNYGVRMVSH